jgi:hypothetical protein
LAKRETDRRVGKDIRKSVLAMKIYPGGQKIFWPWDRAWWKPSPNNRIRDMEKAGALIAAEIDRLQRSQEGEK